MTSLITLTYAYYFKLLYFGLLGIGVFKNNMVVQE